MFKGKRRKDPTSMDDVVVTKKNKVLSLKKKEEFTISLHKQRSKDFFRRHSLWFILSGVFIFFIFLVLSGLLTRAATVNFYPTSCLGGWENSHNAEGQPQAGEGEFNPANSAYLKDRVSQIFCGGFQGELPKDTDPKKILLKFSWKAMKGNPTQEATSTSGDASGTIDPSDDFSNSAINAENPTTGEATSTSIGPIEDTPQFPDEPPSPIIPQEPEPEPEVVPESSQDTSPADTTVAPENISPTPDVEPAPSEPISEPVTFLDLFSKKALAEENKVVTDAGPVFNILYTLNGNDWKTLGTVTEDEIGNKEFEIPADEIYDQEDLSHIQINIQSGTTLDQDITVYLDSLWLEVQYEKLDPNALDERPAEGEAFTGQKKTWRADETPEFTVDLQNVSDTLSSEISSSTPQIEEIKTASTTSMFRKGIDRVESFFKHTIGDKALAQSEEDPGISKIDILDANGKDSELTTKVTDDNQTATIKVERPAGSLKPGKYVVRMNVETPDGLVITEDEFMWGVLAVNTDRSIYKQGDNAYLQMASLNEGGHTLCDSNLTLKIKDPVGNTATLQTDAEIQRSETCSGDNVTDQPDYSAHFQTSVPGTYSMILTNEDTGNAITDSFYVQAKLPYDIKRKGSMRINPFKSDYDMTLQVTANTSFTGKIHEYVPSSFEIATSSGEATVDSVIENGNEAKRISWNVTLAKGESTVLSYRYQAPKISPAIFHLGAADIISYASSTAPQKVFGEKRQWQIASDAACTFNGTGGLSWSTRTWTGCTGGGAPQPGDTVTIGVNQILSFDIASTTIAGMTLANPTSVNGMTMLTGTTLNITGALAFTANTTANGSTITLAGTSTLNVGSLSMPAPSGTGAERITCSIAGDAATLTVSGAISITGNSTSTGLPSIDFGASSTGCKLTAGNVTLTGGSNATGGPALIKMGTGTFTLNGALTFGGANVGKSQLNMAVTGGKISLNGGTLPAVGTSGAYTFTSLTNLDSAGASTVAYATAVTTWGAIHVTSGTLTMSAAAETASSIDIDSGATLAKGASLLTDSGAGANAFICDGTFSGSGGLTLTGVSAQISGTCSSTNTGSFTINGTTAPQFVTGSNYTISGTIALGSAALVTNNATVSQITSTAGMTSGSTASKWTNAAGSSLSINGPMLATPAVGILTANASTNTITYKNTATIKVTSAHYNNLEIASGANTVTAAADTIDGTLTVTSGTFDTGAVILTVTGATSVNGTLKFSSTTGAKTFGNMAINTGGIASFTAAAAPVMKGNLQVDGTGTITGTQGTWAFQKVGGGGTISGTASAITLTAATFTTNYTVSGIGTVTIPTLNINTTLGNLTNLTTMTITTSFTSSNSTFINGTNSTLNNSVLNPGATIDASSTGNTVNYNSASASTQTVVPSTYYNLILSGAGRRFKGGSIDVLNDFTMSGTTSFQPNTGVDDHFKGDWIIDTSTSTPFEVTSSDGSTVYFDTPNTPAATSITGTTNAILTFNNVSITNTSGLSSTENMSASGGNFTVATSTAFSPAAAVIISGTGTLTGNGTVKVTRTAATPDFNSQYTISNKTLTNLTTDYAGTAAQTINGITYGNLLVSNTSATTTLGAAATTTGNLTINSSAKVDSSTFNIVDGGNWSNSGTFAANSNTVTLNDTSGTSTVTTANMPFYNLTFNGAAGFELQDALTVNNNLTITAGILDTKSGSNNPIVVKGNWSNSGTFLPRSGTVSFQKTGAQSISGATTWSTLSVDATSSRTVSFQSGVSQTISANGGLNFTGRSGQPLTLAPITASTTWKLAVSTIGVTQTVTNVTPSFSDASGVASFNQAIAATDSTNTDGGNNTNWNFPTALTCNTNISSTDFGALDISGVKVSSPNATTTMSCSGSTGCSLYMHDLGNTSSPGLYAPLATSSPIILSGTAGLSAGTNGYGAQAATSSAGSGALLVINPIYLKTVNNVGGFTIANSTVASSSAAITSREVVIIHKAALAATTPAGSYSDTITYSCTAN